MSEIEIDEAGELRVRLRYVERDLQHVVLERNRTKDALAAVAARYETLRQAVADLADDLERDPTQGRSPDDRLRAILAKVATL